MATATKKKNKPLPQSVETLRKLGFKVRVYHARRFYSTSWNYSGRFEAMMSKREMTTDPEKQAFMLTCHGGYTRVDITTPDHVELSGKYSFGNRQFDRKLGLRAAIGRAFTGRRSRPSI